MGDITNYAIPLFILTLFIEIGLSIRGNRIRYSPKDTVASLSMGIGSIAIGLFTKGAIWAVFMVIYQFRIYDMPINWWGLTLLVLADDVSYYWFHRISHRVRYFWASHIVHHSSTHYNLSTALRQSWTGDLSGGFLIYAWMPFIGFDPLWILTAKSISLIYQYWVHTETIDKLPRPIEFIFNTPSHHRVHHSSDVKYLDKNYAGILIIWDRMFGSFIEEEETPTYGLVTNIKTYNPLRIAFAEWGNVLSDVWNKPGLLNKIKYVFAPPGWSHDGSRKTTAQLVEEERLKG